MVGNVPKKGDRMGGKLEVLMSNMTIYRLWKYTDRELRIPLAVTVSHQRGDRRKHGEVDRGCVGCGVADRHRRRSNGSIESAQQLKRATTLQN